MNISCIYNVHIHNIHNAHSMGLFESVVYHHMAIVIGTMMVVGKPVISV
jgi:hypothetical protein